MPMTTAELQSTQSVGYLDLLTYDKNNVQKTLWLGYLLYLPEGYAQDPARKWPLILFLHGSEERGNDPDVVRRQALPQLLEEEFDLPAVVLSPQCRSNQRWSDMMQELVALLDHMLSTQAIEEERVYLTGISMGAYGAWELAVRYPQQFAAVVPIAGGYDPRGGLTRAAICALKDVPVWAFHGQRDANVPYTESTEAVEALRACGGDVRLTLYPDADHARSWERAYTDAQLYEWLFAQARNPR
ncbi:MAG: phospholipase [Chloroflexi bacterium]|nr:phospholipase [Chloroflexota bacterium]